LNITPGEPPAKETLILDLWALRTNRTPPEAKILGVGGAIPLLAGVVIVLAVRDPFGIPLVRIILAYAAVILAFLGGIHWGFASAALARSTVELDAPRILGLSVLPPLASCVGVVLPTAFGALFLASAFILVLLLDRTSERLGYTPFWWMKLRVRLTVTVVLLLLLLAIVEFTR
jgi:hypothetical protein